MPEDAVGVYRVVFINQKEWFPIKHGKVFPWMCLEGSVSQTNPSTPCPCRLLPSDAWNLRVTVSIHESWYQLWMSFHFTALAGARRTSHILCSLVTRPVTSRPFIHGREIKPHEFLMALMRNEQQRTKCLSIMHIQCRGSHFRSRWPRLPDLTLRFVGNVKHFGLKHAWA